MSVALLVLKWAVLLASVKVALKAVLLDNLKVAMMDE
jgi:hypothetical protein